MWENFELKVFTADDKMALDWCRNFTSPVKHQVIDIINGTQKPLHNNNQFYRDGVLIYHKDIQKPILRIRGWGYLTGTGGLHLSQEEAIKIQDEFGDYIVEQLNKGTI